MCICMLLYNCCRPDQQELIYSKRNTCSPLFAFQDIETMVLKKNQNFAKILLGRKSPGAPTGCAYVFEKDCLSDSFAEKTNA